MNSFTHTLLTVSLPLTFVLPAAPQVSEAWSEAPLFAAVGQRSHAVREDRVQLEEKTLHDRLGGIHPIAVLVSDFIDRLLVNDTLNANPAIDRAREEVPRAGLKFQVAALVAQATGGPYEYHGRSMRAAHAHLGITEKEWGAMIADFERSLAQFDVPPAEQAELKSILASVKEDVVDLPRKEHEPIDVEPEGTLYARLGGLYPIATVVDAFVDRLLANDTLNANPAIDKARKEVPAPGLKFQVTAMMVELTGGPYTYHGRSMEEAHAHLGITEAGWDAMGADFKTTLDEFGVPEKEQGELFELVGQYKDDIVQE